MFVELTWEVPEWNRVVVTVNAELTRVVDQFSDAVHTVWESGLLDLFLRGIEPFAVVLADSAGFGIVGSLVVKALVDLVRLSSRAAQEMSG